MMTGTSQIRPVKPGKHWHLKQSDVVESSKHCPLFSQVTKAHMLPRTGTDMNHEVVRVSDGYRSGSDIGQW